MLFLQKELSVSSIMMDGWTDEMISETTDRQTDKTRTILTCQFRKPRLKIFY